MSAPFDQRLHNDHNPNQDFPEAIDSERSPQLDKVICRCRCGCTCSSSRGDIDAESGGGGGQHLQVLRHAITDFDITSDGGHAQIDGEHSVEVGDLGVISVRVIMDALAKHSRCACHIGVLPPAEDCRFPPCLYPSASGVFSSDSMAVECGAGGSDITGGGSTAALSSRSGSGSVRSGTFRSFSPCAFAFLGEHFEGQGSSPIAPVPLHHHFTATPVWLTHEREFSFTMEIGVASELLHLPELSLGDSASSLDHSEYDMW